jgi:hypothetical protein
MTIMYAGVLGGGQNPNFATTLYTPPDASGVYRTIDVGVNIGNGGLIIGKNRENGSNHQWIDSVRGNNLAVFSNLTSAQSSGAYAQNFSGNNIEYYTNSFDDIVIWTFLKAAGFFDIVSYTGNSSARTIAHNLNAPVGCYIVKTLGTAGSWFMYHRSMNGGVNPQNYFMFFNTAASEASQPIYWNGTQPTNSVFSLGAATPNPSGVPCIAYLFAHNPSKKIACDGFTTDGSGNAMVSVGFRPQFVMSKSSTGESTDWNIIDKERGANKALRPNSSSAEVTSPTYAFTADGFTVSNETTSQSFIYIAIG